jgi:hypothetical protein
MENGQEVARSAGSRFLDETRGRAEMATLEAFLERVGSREEIFTESRSERYVRDESAGLHEAMLTLSHTRVTAVAGRDERRGGWGRDRG